MKITSDDLKTRPVCPVRDEGSNTTISDAKVRITLGKGMDVLV
jgi:hypothetical protein